MIHYSEKQNLKDIIDEIKSLRDEDLPVLSDEDVGMTEQVRFLLLPFTTHKSQAPGELELQMDDLARMSRVLDAIPVE